MEVQEIFYLRWHASKVGFGRLGRVHERALASVQSGLVEFQSHFASVVTVHEQASAGWCMSELDCFPNTISKHAVVLHVYNPIPTNLGYSSEAFP